MINSSKRSFILERDNEKQITKENNKQITKSAKSLKLILFSLSSENFQILHKRLKSSTLRKNLRIFNVLDFKHLCMFEMILRRRLKF